MGMRKRARRIVIGLGLAAAVLGCCLVALEPDALAMQVFSCKVRIEGGAVLWPRTSSEGRFQGDIDVTAGDIAVRGFLQAIADWSDRLVIIEAADRRCLDVDITIAADMVNVNPGIVRSILRTHGIVLVHELRGSVWSVRLVQLAIGLPDEPSEGTLISVTPRLNHGGIFTDPSASR